MAVAVLKTCDDDENNFDIRSFRSLPERRHYKKDSRFVLDLYTLTYDSHENLDSLGNLTERQRKIRDQCTKNATKDGFKLQRDYSTNSETNSPLWFITDFTLSNDNYIDDEMVSLPIIPSPRHVFHNKDMKSLPVGNELHRTRSFRSIRRNHVDHRPPVPDKQDNRVKVASTDRRPTNKTNTSLFRLPVEFRNQIYASLKRVYDELRRKMESDAGQRSQSPVTCAIKRSLKKVGIADKNKNEGRIRLNRRILNKMNAKQLQIIAHELHVNVKSLNEQLMKMLMERDELRTSRDALWTDIDNMTGVTIKQHANVWKSSTFVSNKADYSKKCNDKTFNNYQPDENEIRTAVIFIEAKDEKSGGKTSSIDENTLKLLDLRKVQQRDHKYF